MVTVHPGEHYATREKLVIATLLGSCVSACLYDPEAGVAGLNHFLLAAPRYSKTMHTTVTEAGRYGIHAMELLINDMMKLGASRSRLRAKAFGGSSIIGVKTGEQFFCVHEVNQRFILEFLADEGIELVSSDLGGERGRVIRFDTGTYKVQRRYIKSSSEEEGVGREERLIWERVVSHPEEREGKIVLFQ